MLAYRIGISLLAFGLKISSLFSPKNKLRVLGQKEVNKLISGKKSFFSAQDFIVWAHSASLGEFEQARPIIEQIKAQHPKVKILVTFFSPSGYEVRKNYTLADFVTYLPLDTPKNAVKFLDTFKPNIAIFVKYEFWYYYYKTCKKRKIPLFSVSTIFRPTQSFFTRKIKFNKVLGFVSHFFVQNKESLDLLLSINYKNATLSGDTRFDRVLALRKQNRDLGLIESFCSRPLTLVIGSAWEEDLIVLKKFILLKQNINVILAPHEIGEKNIEKIKQILGNESVLLSKLTEDNIDLKSILIVDSIGKLTDIYRLADFAYVGGAFGAGLHNILEPATYGIPVVFGPKYDKFQEAKDLVKLEGAFSVKNEQETFQILSLLAKNESTRIRSGKTNFDYVSKNAGACNLIMKHLDQLFPHES